MVEFKKAPRPPEPVVDARADLDAIGFSGSPLEAVVAAIGAGLCLFGAVRILGGARRAFRGRIVSGEVVSIDRKGPRRRQAVIAFEDAEGRRREFLSSRDAGFLKPGTRVSVRFDPSEPRRAEHLGGGLVRLGHLLWPAALGAFLVLAATGGRLPAL